MEAEHHKTKTLFFTAFALMAFAANSLLCRFALEDQTIDAASFSTIRLICGALMLVLISRMMKTGNDVHSSGSWQSSGSWVSAAMLFLYAIAFSFAYNSLTTGTGAIILFGMVQITMILWALFSGERPHPLQWGGLCLALTGLVILVWPGLSAPSLSGSALMATAGIAWGVYSLRGRGGGSPLADTTGNFIRSVPFVLLISLLCFKDINLSSQGVLLAAISGAITSGVGYSIWYAAVKGLSVTQAAIVQLSVPILAAIGGVVFLLEEITTTFAISTVLILGGVTLAVFMRKRVADNSLLKK